MRSAITIAMIAGLMSALAGTASADFEITDFSATSIGFSYPTPSAGQPNTAAIVGNELQVTPGSLSNRGAVWTTDAQSVTGGFTTTFTFEFVGVTGGGGSADGMAFVIQNDSLEAIGDHAAAMAYGGFAVSPDNGIDRSLAIEFDDYYNANWNDPDGNHISVHTMGVVSNSQDHALASIGQTSAIPGFGQFTGSHVIQIDYVPGTLTVFMDDLTVPALEVSVDLAAILESDSAWLGFTGSGGSAYQLERVLAWSFESGGSGGDVFRRGDVNLDGGFDIADAVFTLASLFVPGAPLTPCNDAQDANDDGTLDISDAVFALAALFVPAAPPVPAPGSTSCGADPTADSLDCAGSCP